jgi:hypothetical protein
MLDNLRELERIGVVLTEPASLPVRICVTRCARALNQLPVLNRAGDSLRVVHDLLLNIFIYAEWPGSIDQAQIIRALTLTAIEELEMHRKLNGVDA